MWCDLKFYFVLCIRVAALIILLYFAYCIRRDLKSLGIEEGNIYVLLWTPKFTKPFSSMDEGLETFINRKCPVMNCYVTVNRELLGDISNFDVVLFDVKEIVTEKAVALPQKRTYNQTYVFTSTESAGYYPIIPNTYYGYFNLTWTYKLDSDIYFGYFTIKNINGEIIGPSEDIQWMSHNEMLPTNAVIKKKIANKKIAAAWFVSNCRAARKIQKVVVEIQRAMNEYGLSVDVYGRCGGKKCPKDSLNECLRLLEADYYFYFAFENSFAEDYVTESLLYALNHYTVPIVFGGADYQRFMPDGAYLDATRLTPKELARQMYEIIHEPGRYSSFFKWHNHYSYHEIEESPDTDPFCKLCEYLNLVQSKNRSSMVYYDFEDWWNPHDEQWKKFYNNTVF